MKCTRCLSAKRRPILWALREGVTEGGLNNMPSVLPSSTYRDVFQPRAIARSVAETRPYVYFPEGGLDRILETDPRLEEKWTFRKWARNVTLQSSGVVIVRHPISPELEQPLPELRPDNAVISLHKPPGPTNKPRKYVFPPAPKGGKGSARNGVPGTAKRFDVHPLAAPLDRPGPLFLCMEGCLKADSILSADYDAISVPSVTCWKGNDLDAAVERMVERQRRAGAPTFVVTDSDWFVNDQVAKQAQLLSGYLRGAGVWAVPVAPPAARNGEKVGVDDYLAGGGQLLELHDVTPRPRLSEDDVLDLVRLRARTERIRNRDDALERAARVLMWMQKYCTGSGIVSGYDMEIAEGTGLLTRGKAQGAIKKLLELRLIREEKASEFVGGAWSPRRWVLLDQHLIPNRIGTARSVILAGI